MMDDLGAYAAAVCERATGMSVEAWEAEFSKRRRWGFASEDLHPGMIYTPREMAQMTTRYGLDVDDMIALLMPTKMVRMRRLSVTIPIHNGREPDRMLMYILNPDRYPA